MRLWAQIGATRADQTKPGRSGRVRELEKAYIELPYHGGVDGVSLEISPRARCPDAARDRLRSKHRYRLDVGAQPL